MAGLQWVWSFAKFVCTIIRRDAICSPVKPRPCFQRQEHDQDQCHHCLASCLCRFLHSIFPCLDPKLHEMECLSSSQEKLVIPELELSKEILKQRQVYFIQDGLKDLKSIFFPIKLILPWILSGRHALNQAQYASKQGLYGMKRGLCSRSSFGLMDQT